MVRRAGIHRIAAVVARRSSAEAARGPGADLAQLELFAVDAPHVESAAFGATSSHGEPTEASLATDPLEPPARHDTRATSAPMVALVASCPACTWWVSRTSSRCDNCGVSLVEGALAPQGELAFDTTTPPRPAASRPAPSS